MQNQKMFTQLKNINRIHNQFAKCMIMLLDLKTNQEFKSIQDFLTIVFKNADVKCEHFLKLGNIISNSEYFPYNLNIILNFEHFS